MRKAILVSSIVLILVSAFILTACAPKELTANDVVQKMADNSKKLKTGHTDMQMNISAAGQTITGSMQGIFENPDKSLISMDLLGTHVEVLTQSPADVYQRPSSSQAWQKVPQSTTSQFGNALDISKDPEKLLKYYKNLKLIGKEAVDEVECYHLSFELDLMEVMTGLGVNTASLAGASFKGPAAIESWVGSKDFFTRKMNEKFTMLSEGQEVIVDVTVHLTELNKPVEIPKP